MKTLQGRVSFWDPIPKKGGAPQSTSAREIRVGRCWPTRQQAVVCGAAQVGMQAANGNPPVFAAHLIFAEGSRQIAQ